MQIQYVVLAVVNSLMFFYFIVQLMYIKNDMKHVKFNMDTIIEFIMQRASMAGKRSHFFMENSPLQIIDDEVRPFYAPILSQLKCLCQELKDKDDQVLWMAIQSNFGQWIVDNVCQKTTPVMGTGEYVTIAMILSKEE